MAPAQQRKLEDSITFMYASALALQGFRVTQLEFFPILRTNARGQCRPSHRVPAAFTVPDALWPRLIVTVGLPGRASTGPQGPGALARAGDHHRPAGLPARRGANNVTVLVLGLLPASDHDSSLP